MLSIPKVDLDKFDGNPQNYQTFVAIFDEAVDSKISQGQVKLTRLLQYTCGSTKAAIKNCALIGGDEGYHQAREILKHRFGNTHLVSRSIINDLKSGKSVCKPNDLQQFADDLVTGLTALEKLGAYSEINTQQGIIEILERCPNYLRNLWQKEH